MNWRAVGLMISVSLGMVTSPTIAQVSETAGPFDGEWVLRFSTAAGITYNIDGLLTIKGSGGTYWIPRADRENTCGKLAYPIEEVVNLADRLEFLVARSKKLTGCEDYRFRLALQGGRLVGSSFLVTSDGETKSPIIVTAVRK